MRGYTGDKGEMQICIKQINNTRYDSNKHQLIVLISIKIQSNNSKYQKLIEEFDTICYSVFCLNNELQYDDRFESYSYEIPQEYSFGEWCLFTKKDIFEIEDIVLCYYSEIINAIKRETIRLSIAALRDAFLGRNRLQISDFMIHFSQEFEPPFPTDEDFEQYRKLEEGYEYNVNRC